MKAIVWSKPNCPNCDIAKNLLANKGYEIIERKIGFGWNTEQLFEAVPNARTVPQIFIDGQYIGGSDDLKKYLSEAK